MECTLDHARALTNEGEDKNGPATVKRALVRWVAGIAALLLIDIIAEALVFEWLGWNGTTKNDWFFMLWWAVVLGWTIHGSFRVWRSVRGSSG